MSLTVAQFRARIDEQLLVQLTDPSGQAVNENMLACAVADAAGIIAGYTFRLAPADTPPEVTLDAHQVSLALYALGGNRPGSEFDSIRSRKNAAIAYLDSLRKEQGIAIDVEIDSPEPQFDTASLDLFKGVTDDG